MANERDSMRDKMRRAGRVAGTNRRSAPRKPNVSGQKPGLKKRTRPTVRAQETQRKISQRPMPKPPARRPPIARPTAAAAVGARAVSEELQATVNQIHTKFERLEADAQLSDVYDAIGRIDAQLTELPFALEALRDRGYVHAGQLEDLLEALDDKWDEVRPRVESALRSQVSRLDTEMDQAERQVNNLRPTNQGAVRLVETAVNGLENRIRAAKTAVSGLYDGIESELYTVSYEMDKVTKMLDLLDGSPEIRMQEAEGPLLAVESEWQQDGEEGPKGYLFLTDQRLMFEQREEVVTKKRFGIFKAESEMLQKLHVAVSVHDIESIEHKEEGGFLGMGKADIIELVFAATAPLSRARFHLKGQESSDWAAMIKRIQTGDIDEDRADEYVDEMEAAAETAAAFPEKCPTCFADVPPQQRGVTSITCEFCGSEITPVLSD
ncbi:MAG: hypothetical protein KC419_17915 [Anaerolineales bacterium]|nr:hypothetical protein [Anaerolineales bacterium]